MSTLHKLLHFLACAGSGALAGGIIQWQLVDAGYTARQAGLLSVAMGVAVYLLCYYITLERDDYQDRGKRND